MEDPGNSLGNQQPGQTITPTAGSAAEPPQPAASPTPPPAVPAPPAGTPEPSPAAPAPTAPAEPKPAAEEPAAPLVVSETASPKVPQPAQPEEAQDDNKFDASPSETPAENGDLSDTQPITWTASEFIAHAKSFGWYAALALVTIALDAFVFLVTRDLISVGAVIFGAIIFGIYAGHKPRELEYRLDGLGLSIGQKHFGYDQFRCFSVLPEGGVSSIVFMPMKRFAMPTTIYYPPEDENKIVDLLGSCLPLEERGHDAVDRLMHRIHF